MLVEVGAGKAETTGKDEFKQLVKDITLQIAAGHPHAVAREQVSADVIANADSIVLKMSDVAFDRLTREAPALATPFLQATARTLAARIRADNQRLARVTEQFQASI